MLLTAKNTLYTHRIAMESGIKPLNNTKEGIKLNILIRIENLEPNKSIIVPYKIIFLGQCNTKDKERDERCLNYIRFIIDKSRFKTEKINNGIKITKR